MGIYLILYSLNTLDTLEEYVLLLKNYVRALLNVYVYFTLIPFLLCECRAVGRTFCLHFLVRTYQSRAHGLSLFLLLPNVMCHCSRICEE